MISNELTIAAKRIAKQMVALSQAQIDMNMFMGLGLALQTVYEVATGRSIVKYRIKPLEVLQWAVNLPQVHGQEIEIDLSKIPEKQPGSLLV